MLHWLKDHFIPHTGNNHRPHLLRGKNARRIVLLALVVELLIFALPASVIFKGGDFIASVLPAVLNELTNEKRVVGNLSELKTSEVLTKAAKLKAEDMASKSYFAHTSPEGLTPWYWLGTAGYSYAYAGENLAVNFIDSKDVTDAWMNSPSHRANILKQDYTEIGTGVATGIYKGREAIFVVQYYAAPKSALGSLLTTVIPTASAQTQTSVAPSKKVTTNPPSKTTAIKPAAKSVSTLSPNTVPAESAQAPQTEALTAQSEKIINTTPLDPTVTESTLWAKLISSPRADANYVLLGMLGVVLLAFVLNIVIKFEVQHPDLITNGLAVAVIIFGIYLTNTHIIKAQTSVPLDQSFAMTIEPN